MLFPSLQSMTLQCGPEVKQEQVKQVALVHDIFGNSFRQVAFDPAWRSSTAVPLARRVYQSRDFSPMPILADALQDAGSGGTGWRLRGVAGGGVGTFFGHDRPLIGG